MRWPFGPPHLTLKPSKKNKKKKKTKKKKKKQKKENKGQKNKEITKIPKKSFSVISQFFLFLVGVQNFPFLTTWPKKRAPKKHYKNRGFSNPFCGKQFWVTKRPFLDKKSQIQKFQLSFFFCLFLLLQQQKTQKLAETPIFIVFWQT